MFSSVQPSSTTDTIVTVKSKCVLELFDNMNFISRESKFFFFFLRCPERKKHSNQQMNKQQQLDKSTFICIDRKRHRTSRIKALVLDLFA